MAVFEYGTESSQTPTGALIDIEEALAEMTMADKDVNCVSVVNNGARGRTNLTVTIPAAIRKEQEITDEDSVLMKPVGDDGILVRRLRADD